MLFDHTKFACKNCLRLCCLQVLSMRTRVASELNLPRRIRLHHQGAPLMMIYPNSMQAPAAFVESVADLETFFTGPHPAAWTLRPRDQTCAQTISSSTLHPTCLLRPSGRVRSRFRVAAVPTSSTSTCRTTEFKGNFPAQDAELAKF